MKRASIPLAALAVLCVGCGHPGAYVKDRANDFADCFTLEAGLGVGADVEVHVTDYLAAGIGASQSRKHGFAGRHPVGFLDPGTEQGLDLHLGFPVAPIYFWFAPPEPMPPPEADEILRFMYTHVALRDVPYFRRERAGVSRSLLVLNVDYLFKDKWPGEKAPPIETFDLGVGATLVLVSVRAAFSPGQLADFLVGWTTLDLAGDDRAD